MNNDVTELDGGSSRWADRLAWAFLGLAALARIAGAWGVRAVTDMDTSVVALMARHMARGTDWPVFFYGQGYMGSLEPAGSALLMRLFGDNGFVLALGPVMFAMIALWALWRWARMASGARGGAAAVLLGMVGPAVYFAFQFAARGGYMVALTVDALALWAAAGLAAEWWQGARGGVWKAALLGLLAGVGIWSDQIVVPALAAAVLVMLVGMRGRFWEHWGVVGAGVVGTVVGTSPWWLWWLFHEGNVFGLPPGAHRSLGSALQLTWQRYLMFQGEGFPKGLCIALAMAGLVLAGAGLAAWAAAARRRGARSNFATLGALLFVFLFICAFVFSGFSQERSGRYWVPAWPGLAVLGGWACAGWEGRRGGRWARMAAWGLAGALVAAQVVLVAQIVAATWTRAGGDLQWQAGMREAIESTGADAVMAPRQFYPLNYAWRETLPVSDGMLQFYAPVRREAELAEHPAYFTDWKGIEALFERMGIGFERTAHGRVLFRAQPPPQGEVLAWRLSAPTEEGGAILELNPPQAIERVAFRIHRLERLANLPQRFDIGVRENGEWRTVYENAPLPAMTWSGTRAYLDGGAYQEFPVESAQAEAMRIIPRGMLKSRLKHLDLMACGPEHVANDTVGDADGALEALLALAGDDAAVYAPRWLANRLHRSGRIDDRRNRGLAVRIFGSESPDERAELKPGRPFAAAVERRYAAMVRESFSAAGIPLVEVASPPEGWSLFRGTIPKSGTDLRWTGRWFAPEE